jgi:hypothetical protein
VKDVHLCVAHTTHSDAGEKTDWGDPANSHYLNKATLPYGWNYRGVVETKKGSGSDWCVTWVNPDNGLDTRTVFSVAYCGGRAEVQKSGGNKLVVLTATGADTLADPKDVVGPRFPSYQPSR